MHLEAAPLETLRGAALETLLTLERQDYQRTYRWNFEYSARLVNDLVATRGLAGMVLLAAGEPNRDGWRSSYRVGKANGEKGAEDD